MDVLYNDSETFYFYVSLFWERNTPMFNRLAETEEYTYDPLTDHKYKTHRDAEGKQHKDSQVNDTYSVAAFDQNDGYSPKDHTNTTNVSNGNWDDKYDITRDGINRYTYQQLIDQQRKSVEFHADDYILRYWAKELMIGIW